MNLDWIISVIHISIHALRGEGDPCPVVTFVCFAFLSTPSVGRATISLLVYPARTNSISIHALRGEGDGKSA